MHLITYMDRIACICWACENAYGGKCCWIDNGEPIPVQIAQLRSRAPLRKTKCHTSTVDRIIISCPNFAEEALANVDQALEEAEVKADATK